MPSNSAVKVSAKNRIGEQEQSTHTENTIDVYKVRPVFNVCHKTALGHDVPLLANGNNCRKYAQQDDETARPDDISCVSYVIDAYASHLNFLHILRKESNHSSTRLCLTSLKC